MIKILFFAALREKIGCSELILDNENITTIEQVISALISQHPEWKNTFTDSLLCAINQEMVNKNHTVNTGDEVAFFPPVTGG